MRLMRADRTFMGSAGSIWANPFERVAVVNNQVWTAIGDCRNSPALFELAFEATEKTRKGREVLAACRSVCAVCPVRRECLKYALDNESGKASSDRFGVYGGTLPHERAEMS